MANVGGQILNIPTICRAVYNFEVEDHHSYFVGEQGLWVHNTGECGGYELVPAKKLIQDTEFGGVSKSMLKKSRLDFDKIGKCE
ncbi:HINT domain-containing protein [Acinetobacter bohemicus]|nr:HINT domain-containing protein [Acinetobacter bohemicus]